MRTIVIASHGWVFVGDATHKDSIISLENASVIRQWGTTKGIGQLANEGATSNTVLDYCGLVMIPNSAVIAYMPVNPNVTL